MNFYDGLTWMYWLLLLYFVVLIGWNLFEEVELRRKVMAAAILAPFLLRLLGIA